MRTRSAIPCLFLSLLLAASIRMPAQQASSAPEPASDPTYTLKVNTQLVVLDVVVTDKKGNVVTNLKRDDFQVTEDGQPQTIKSFEAPGTHALPPKHTVDSTAQLDHEAPDAPVSILVLDEMNTRFEDEAFARYSLKKYLNSLGDTLAQPTMLVAVDLQNFNVLQDYTTSKAEVLSALEHHLARYPWHLSNGSNGASWAAEMFNASFNALMEVAQATSGHPGHKNVIWIGRGFPSVNVENLMPQDQDMLEQGIQNCTNMLRDARITLYTVDPAGLSAAAPAQDINGFSDDDPFGGNINFNTMALATGGQSFYNQNDVDHLIQKSVDGGVSFYTLTYRPSQMQQQDKPFRKIHVTLKEPGLTATTREGYYLTSGAPIEPPLKPNGQPGDQMLYDLSLAAHSVMVYDAVPLSILRDTADSDTFTIHVNEGGLDWQTNAEGKKVADLAILLAVYDRKGKLLERNAQHVIAPQTPTATGEQMQERALDIHTKLKVAPPAARIRVVVRVNTTGKLGAENYYLIDKRLISTPTTIQTHRK